MKFVGCFPAGLGVYTSILVNFKLKSLWTNLYLKSNEICINQRVVEMLQSSYPTRTQLPLKMQ